MSYKNTIENKEYMREYMRNRYHKIRLEYIKKLGGECVLCGSKEKLEFDHINEKEKKYNMAKIFSFSRDKIDKEINKCRLLCNECHKIRTINQQGKRVAKGTHGTVSSRRYCNCVLCKKAHADYMRVWKKEKAKELRAS